MRKLESFCKLVFLALFLGACAGDAPTSPGTIEVISDDVDPDPPAPPSGNIVTQHTLTQRLEDGWTERQPPSEWYTNGVENGDGYGQALYSPSLCIGCGPIQVRRGWQSLDEVTVDMRWQVSPNMSFATGSTNKKIYFLEASNTHPIILGAKARGAFYLATQRTARPNGGSRQLEGGSWEAGRIYDVRLYIKLNTVQANGDPNADGVGTVWVDGVQVIHADDFQFRGNTTDISGETWEPQDGIDGMRWSPTWVFGNGAQPPAEDMWERIYDFKVTSGQDQLSML